MNPYTDNLDAAQARISSLENEMCDDCRKKTGLPPKASAKPEPQPEPKPTENPVFSSKAWKEWRPATVLAAYIAIILAALWGIWSIVAPVPAMTKIVWDDAGKNVTYLSFAVSSWWSVLSTPIFVFLAFMSISLVFRLFDKSPLYIADGVGTGLFFGLALGVVCGVLAELLTGGLLPGTFFMASVAANVLLCSLIAALLTHFTRLLVWTAKKIGRAFSWFFAFNVKIFKL